MEALVDLATVTNDVVLEPHAERLRILLSQISPILGSLADRTDVLADLVTNLLRFTEAVPDARCTTARCCCWPGPTSPTRSRGPSHGPDAARRRSPRSAGGPR